MNPIVEQFRKYVPGVDLSDEELTEVLYDATRDDPVFDDDKKFVNDALDIKHRRGAARPGNELTRSFGFGAQDIASKLAGTAALVGRKVGSESMEESGLGVASAIREQARPNAPTIQSLKEVRSPGEFGRYVAGLVGSQAPQLAGTAALSMIPAAGKPLAAAFAFSQAQNYQDLVEQGADRDTAANTAIAVGTVSGLLETALPLRLANPILKQAPAQAAKTAIQKTLSKLPPVIARSVENMTLEGSTETLQEIVAIAGETYANQNNPKFKDPDTDDIIDRLVDAGFGGAILGGLTGPLGNRAPATSQPVPASQPAASGAPQQPTAQPPTQATGQQAQPVQPGVQPQVPPQVQPTPAAGAVEIPVEPIIETGVPISEDDDPERVPVDQSGIIPDDEVAILAQTAAEAATGNITPDQEAEIISSVGPQAVGVYAELRAQADELVNQSGGDQTNETQNEAQGQGIQTQGQQEELLIQPQPQQAVPVEPQPAPAVEAISPALVPQTPEVTPPVAAEVPQAQPVQPVDPNAPHPITLEQPRNAYLNAVKSARGKGKGAEQVRVEPMAFIVADADYSPELAQRLTSMSSPPGVDIKKSSTFRMAFFEDQETGEVIGVGTYNQGGVARVGVLPGKKSGTTLQKLLSEKFEGEQKYVPIFSLYRENLVEATDPASAVVFADAREFERKLQGPIMQKIAAMKDDAPGSEGTAFEFNDEGEATAVATEEAAYTSATSPEEAVFETLLDVLPRNPKTGMVPRDLNISDIVDAMAVGAEEDPNFLRNLFAVMGTDVPVDNQQFKLLPVDEQRALVTKHVAERIKRAAKAGAFEPGSGSVSSPAIGAQDQVTPESRQVADQATEGAKARFRVESEERLTQPALESNYRAAVEALANQGVDVTVLSTEGIQGGLTSASGRRVVLALRDATNPTTENLTTLFHEAAHALFSALPISISTRIQRAVTNLRVEGWTPTMGGVSTTAEEHLAEAAARALVDQGFNVQEASAITSRIWRAVKGSYLRALMAVQTAMFGQASQDAALQYFTVRLESYLGGTVSDSISQFFGGNKSPQARQVRYSQANGVGWVPYRMDPDTGVVMMQDVHPDSIEAARFGVRFRVQTSVNDPRVPLPADANAASIIAERNLAVQKVVNDALEDAFNHWVAGGGASGGVTFDAFLRNSGIISLKHVPSDIVREVNAELAELGLSPQAPVDLASLRPYQRKDVARSAYPIILKAFQDLRENSRESEHLLDPANPRNLEAKFQKRQLELNQLRQDYRNAKAASERMLSAMGGMLQKFGQDMKLAASVSNKIGTLAQVIKSIEGDISAPALRPYALAVNRIWAKYNNGSRLYNLLAKVATDSSLDFKNDSTKDLNAKLRLIGQTDNDLIQLTGTDDDSKALRAMVIAFGKRNYDYMAALEIERADAAQEKAALAVMLKDLFSLTSQQISDARKDLLKFQKIGRAATRLLDKLAEFKAEQKALELDIERRRKLISFEASTRASIQFKLSLLEAIIGSQFGLFEARDGATYHVPPDPATPVEDVMTVKNQKKVVLGRNGMPVGDVRRDRAKIAKWLLNNPNQSAVRTQLQQVHDKLELVEAAAIHANIHSSLVQRAAGSIVKVLDYIGLAPARLATQQIRRFSWQKETWLPQARSRGAKWDALESKAMSAIAPKNWTVNQFRNVFYNHALRFISSNDYLLRSMTPDQAETQALAALRLHFSRNPETAKAATSDANWKLFTDYLKETSRVNQWLDSVRKQLGVKVEEESTNDLKFFRETIGHGLFHVPRGMSGFAKDVHDAMVGQMTRAGRLNPKKMAQEYAADPVAFTASMDTLFGGRIFQDFVGPIARKTGASLFSSYERSSGVTVLAGSQNVREAYQGASNVVEFAANLYQLEGGPGPVTPAFVAETISTLQGIYQSIHGIMQEDSRSNVQDDGMSVRSYMMDARQFDDFPAEFVEYRAFGAHDMHMAMESCNYDNAVGRDAASVFANIEAAQNQLKQMVSKKQSIIEGIIAANPAGISATKLAAEYKVRAEAIGGRGYHISLDSAEKNLTALNREAGFLEKIIGSTNHTPQEMRNFFEVVSAIAGSTVQGFATAIMDTLSVPEQTIRKLGLSSTAAKTVAKSGFAIGGRLAGSVFAGPLRLLGIQLHIQSEYANRLARVGQVDTDPAIKLKDRFVSAIRSPVTPSTNIPGAAQAEILAVKTARSVKALLQTGFGGGGPGSYASVKPALYTWLGQVVNEGAIIGWWQAYEDMVLRGVEHFRKSPADMDDPDFQFTPELLGYRNGMLGFGSDANSYKFLRYQMDSFGINLEDATRRAVDNLNSGRPIFTDDEYRALSAVVRNEITGDSNITNRPTITQAETLAHSTMPLLGWSINKAVDVVTSFARDPNGEASWNAAFKSLWVYGAIVPLGIGYAIMRDEVDREWLNKKSGNLSLDDKEAKWKVIVNQMARVGTFGILGDAIDSKVNQLPGRELSLDRRVFFVSSIQSVWQSLSALTHQDMEVSYGTFYRPLMMSLGGAGAMQNFQVLNTMTGADNAEAREVSRINVNNWIRSGARSSGIELRKWRGGDITRTPATPFVGRMVVAALADDSKEFLKAYKGARAATEKMIAENPVKDGGRLPDPAKVVLKNIESRHPLKAITARQMTEDEVRLLIAGLPEDGKADVIQAVRNFNKYIELLGGKAFWGSND